MKHGGYSDLEELFALATISEDLRYRGELNNCRACAIDMQQCLPEFSAIYISPFHISKQTSEEEVMRSVLFIKKWSFDDLPKSPTGSPNTSSFGKWILNDGVSLKMCEDKAATELKFNLDTESEKQNLTVALPKHSYRSINLHTISCSLSAKETTTVKSRSVSNFYQTLKAVEEELLPIMKDRAMNITLGQKAIGGNNPKSGNQWLYEGLLKDRLLETLITKFIQVIHKLKTLTLEEEKDVFHEVQREVELLLSGQKEVEEISATTNTFVGKHILKNFHPTKGRLRFLSLTCSNFRLYDPISSLAAGLSLAPMEILPAKHLGNLVRPGALMSDIFVDSPDEEALFLQDSEEYWRSILRAAVLDGTLPTAGKDRLWNSGLSDAGIHNLFVDENDLFFFDLGKPELQSLPGFLTKFLFSFFHTLGMQEDNSDDEDDINTEWKCRFVVRGSKLALSQETIDLLPKAYDAFEKCLDRLVSELLNDNIRWLLLQYVTLQLLSDASFCLQRWEFEGGGSYSNGIRRKRKHTGEKWLWRALWDVYMAYDINTHESMKRFKVNSTLR